MRNKDISAQLLFFPRKHARDDFCRWRRWQTNTSIGAPLRSSSLPLILTSLNPILHASQSTHFPPPERRDTTAVYNHGSSAVHSFTPSTTALPSATQPEPESGSGRGLRAIVSTVIPALPPPLGTESVSGTSLLPWRIINGPTMLQTTSEASGQGRPMPDAMLTHASMLKFELEPVRRVCLSV